MTVHVIALGTSIINLWIKILQNNLVMTTTFLKIINTIKDDLYLINNTLCVTADITIFRKFHWIKLTSKNLYTTKPHYLSFLKDVCDA